jgi:hypothetical protein
MIGLREELMVLPPVEIIDRILRVTLRFENAVRDRVTIDAETILLATELELLRQFCPHRGYHGESSIYRRELWTNKPPFACAVCRKDFRANPLGDELMPEDPRERRT